MIAIDRLLTHFHIPMKKKRRRNGVVLRIALVLIGLVSLVFIILSHAGIPPEQKVTVIPSYAEFDEINPAKNHFLVVGDTQKTSRWEFWRERNEKERKRIIDEISTREPAFILHLGDLTTRGSSRKHWEEFDDLNGTLRKKRIPWFPVLGNHEFYGNNRDALEHYFGRFPHLTHRRWYSFTWKNAGLILLDSNFADLTPEQIEKQQQGYLSELQRFEKESPIDHVIVCCHHPPFTNSQVVAPSEMAKRQFAEPFIRFQKTSFFFSGHGHTYERFRAENKFFIVTGGGGGPRHKVYADPKKRRFDDLFPGPELRFFNFCEIEISNKNLAYKVLRLEPDGTFATVDPLRR
jgi:hypothetical protein